MRNWLTQTIQRIFNPTGNPTILRSPYSAAVFGATERQRKNAPERLFIAVKRYKPSIAPEVYQALVDFRWEIDDYLRQPSADDRKLPSFFSVWPEVETALFMQHLKNHDWTSLQFNIVNLETAGGNHALLRADSHEDRPVTYHACTVSDTEMEIVGESATEKATELLKQLFREKPLNCNCHIWSRCFVLDDVVETLQFWDTFPDAGFSRTFPLTKLRAPEHYAQNYVEQTRQFLIENVCEKSSSSAALILDENTRQLVFYAFLSLLTEKYRDKVFLVVSCFEHTEEDARRVHIVIQLLGVINKTPRNFLTTTRVIEVTAPSESKTLH